MPSPALFNSDMSNKEREFFFMKAAERLSLPAYVVEKDYILCIVLSIIFGELKSSFETETPFLFKGGTTLSKVYGLINRMSEDIDLSISMEFLGYPEPTGDESNSALKRRVDNLRDANTKFVTGALKSTLEEALSTVAEGFDVLIDDQESQNLIIHYPKSLPSEAYGSSYIQPRILIETGGRASFHPHESHEIKPMIIDELMEHLDIELDCPVAVDVLSKDRTFFEKLTLLHEINSRGEDAVTDRQSRHIYDLVEIYHANPAILENTDLLEDVRQHKARYFRRGASKWELAVPGTIAILPKEAVKDALKQDWEKMTDLFPSGQLPYNFEELMVELDVINTIINGG